MSAESGPSERCGESGDRADGPGTRTQNETSADRLQQAIARQETSKHLPDPFDSIVLTHIRCIHKVVVEQSYSDATEDQINIVVYGGGAGGLTMMLTHFVKTEICDAT